MEKLKANQKRRRGSSKTDSEPTQKRKKTVPEDQLKFERVLRNASVDSSIIQKVQPKKDVDINRLGNSKRKRPASQSKPSRKSNDKSSKVSPHGSSSDASSKGKATQKLNLKQQTSLRHSNPMSSSSKTDGDDLKESDYFPKPKQSSRGSSFIKDLPKGQGSPYHTSEKKPQESQYFKKYGGAPVNKASKNLKQGPFSPSRSPPKNTKRSKSTDSENLDRQHKKKTQRQTIEVKDNVNSRKVLPSKTTYEQQKTTVSKNSPINPKPSVSGKSPVSVPKLKPSTSKTPSPTQAPKADPDSDSESEESDWEEVEDGDEGNVTEPVNSQLPSQPVTITLKGPDLMHKKRGRTKEDIQAYIRRKINRAQQEIQLQMHKVHLLCLLSHGFHRNRTCLDKELLAFGLSIVPSRFQERNVIHWDATLVKNLVKWFYDFFTIGYDVRENNGILKDVLIQRMQTRVVASEAELVFLMIIMLRGLGAQVRLVTSLQPVSAKCSKKLKVQKVKTKEEEDNDDDHGIETVPSTQNNPAADASPPKPSEQDSEVMAMLQAVEGKGQSNEHKESKTTLEINTQGKKKTNTKSTTKEENMATVKPSKEHKSKSDQSTSSKSSGKRKAPSSKQKRKDTAVTKEEEESPEPSQKTKNLLGKASSSKIDYDEYIKGHRKGRRKSRDGSPDLIELSSDSDFEEIPTKLRKSPSVRKKGNKAKGKKMVSSDSDDVTVTKVVKTEKGTDYALEVYIERAENWIPIDCIRGSVNCASKIESHATQPVYYVLAYDNDQCIKDVTPRYASSWMSTTRKMRKDERWWEDVLDPYRPRNRKRDEAEDAILLKQQLKKPLPTSISEFKNHPLYALKRHLLKFECIYPPDAVPTGYIKGEPVYSRECVHELHTRETWLKEGRAVRVKEKPYKLVKARKKRSRKTFEVPLPEEEKQAECFGRWQTEQYMPPPCYNGKVPRNEYGNVEIFKPWMIPPGGVHLQIPGLKMVAKKLGIDCAPAMVGWDFHGGFNHPIMDGFIVCEEHKDILLAAWDEEQEIQREKEAQKREQRAMANWKKMVKSLLLRERMKIRFDLQEAKKSKVSGNRSQEVEPLEKAKDTQHAWPANRPDHVNKLSTADQTTLFPSEEI